MLNYSTTGDRGKTPLLFLHGFMGSHEDWADAIGELWADHYCIAVDLPGHGRSVRVLADRTYTFHGIGPALREVLDDLEIDRTHIVGYSMGGRIGLHFAMTNMDRCEGIVMEAASPGLRTGEECARRTRIDDERGVRLRTGSLEQFVNDWYQVPLFKSLRDDAKKFDSLLAKRMQNVPKELAKAVTGFSPGRQPSYWIKLDKLQIPMLIIAGSLDQRYAVLGLEMANLCPMAETVIVRDAGHNVHVEQPVAFASAVREFIGTGASHKA